MKINGTYFKKLSISLLLIGVCLFVMIIAETSQQQWQRLSSAKIIIDQTLNQKSRVYSSKDGKYLVLIPGTDGYERCYVVLAKASKILVGGRFNFIILPWVAFDRHDYFWRPLRRSAVPPHHTPLMSDSPVH